MAENNCMCQEAGVLIFPCSGGSDVGELSDRAARTMAKCGQARMFCLAGIGAHVPGMIESAVDDDSIKQVLSKIAGGKVEEAPRNTPGGCCGR